MFGLCVDNDSDELRYLLDGRVEYQLLFGRGAPALPEPPPVERVKGGGNRPHSIKWH